ncbi:MAG: hypothetical protein P1U86_12560 [Verrucomicrobiales bacterium]|nr:hypothetical protein [Verrucomicrobiales bacterium]
MKFLITRWFALSILFTPLSGLTEEAPVTPDKWFELRDRLFSEGEEKDSLEGIAIPQLTSPSLAQSWGTPAIHVLKDGSYSLRYHNPDPDSPFETLIILGFATPVAALASVPDQSFDEEVNGELASVERPQSWKSVKVSIAGDTGGKRKLQFFREYAGGGADGPRDSTDTFTLTANGKTGHYIVIVDTITDATKKRLKTLAVE